MHKAVCIVKGLLFVVQMTQWACPCTCMALQTISVMTFWYLNYMTWHMELKTHRHFEQLAAWTKWLIFFKWYHYYDVIMGAIVSQITSLTIVYSLVYSGADQRKHQSSASLAFMSGIHRGPVNSLHKGPETRRMVPFDDIIIFGCTSYDINHIVI